MTVQGVGEEGGLDGCDLEVQRQVALRQTLVADDSVLVRVPAAPGFGITLPPGLILEKETLLTLMLIKAIAMSGMETRSKL